MSLRVASQRALRVPHLLCRNIEPPSRSFISIPGLTDNSSSQHLTATRTLPYATGPLYTLIADVDSYSAFVPYCSHSRVISHSLPDPETGVRQPILADLHVGWGGFDEKFTSRLRCVPGVSVEALSGGGGEDGNASAVFKSLVTRWTLRKVEEKKTEVHLDIKYQFTSPLYAAVSAAVSDRVATMMVEAFEKQAKQQLG